MIRIRTLVLYFTLIPLCLVVSNPQQSLAHPGEDDSEEVNTDGTIDELPARLGNVPSRTPAESMKQIEMRKGFEVKLVAAEPLLRDPAAVDFDEYGRMFVAELPEYNAYAVEGFEGKGSVKMLTDTDGDGQYDTSTVYAGDLNYPTGVACWDGGVFIGAAPDLMYVKDTDGDGKADTKKVIFTGFEKDKAGEGHLNSFRWGYDNHIHFLSLIHI